MAKVGLKDTLSLLAKGYSKKEIDALAAIDEENEQEATETAGTEAPKPSAIDNKKAQDDAAVEESNPEPDYKSMYEELLEKNKQTEAKVTKLQQANVNNNSAPASEEFQKKQEEDLQNLFRSFM